MDLFTAFTTHYLDTVFARDPHATWWLAMLYSLGGFAGMYMLFVLGGYVFLRAKPTQQLINSRPLRAGQIRHEIHASIVSMAMFSVLTSAVFLAIQRHWLRVDGPVNISRWVVEVGVLFIWNELHFYFSHRLFHTKFLFVNVHAVHHHSIVVTPFASWRFHWFEAVWLGAVMPLVMLFHTFSVWSLLWLPPLSLLWNVVGHSNWRPQSPWLGWLARASERHALHHSRSRGNYGFSLPLLDRWFHTSIEKS